MLSQAELILSEVDRQVASRSLQIVQDAMLSLQNLVTKGKIFLGECQYCWALHYYTRTKIEESKRERALKNATLAEWGSPGWYMLVRQLESVKEEARLEKKIKDSLKYQ